MLSTVQMPRMGIVIPRVGWTCSSPIPQHSKQINALLLNLNKLFSDLYNLLLFAISLTSVNIMKQIDTAVEKFQKKKEDGIASPFPGHFS